jgi:hypothetical protein
MEVQINARQRRAAYRANPQPGQAVIWKRKDGSIRAGIVQMRKEWHHGQFNEERLNVPSVHRVRILAASGGYCMPLVSQLEVIPNE